MGRQRARREDGRAEWGRGDSEGRRWGRVREEWKWGNGEGSAHDDPRALSEQSQRLLGGSQEEVD